MRPERTDDLYFVADGSGGHVFAKTLAEQSHNIALYHHGAAPEPEAPPPPPIAAAAKPPPPPAAEKPHPHPKQIARAIHHPVRTAEQAAREQHCRIAGRHDCTR
jgi:hypothetical protein